jgi:hypothetical protein
LWRPGQVRCGRLDAIEWPGVIGFITSSDIPSGVSSPGDERRGLGAVRATALGAAAYCLGLCATFVFAGHALVTTRLPAFALQYGDVPPRVGRLWATVWLHLAAHGVPVRFEPIGFEIGYWVPPVLAGADDGGLNLLLTDPFPVALAAVLATAAIGSAAVCARRAYGWRNRALAAAGYGLAAVFSAVYSAPTTAEGAVAGPSLLHAVLFAGVLYPSLLVVAPAALGQWFRDRTGTAGE